MDSAQVASAANLDHYLSGVRAEFPMQSIVEMTAYRGHLK